jgi:hypothetical protein
MEGHGSILDLEVDGVLVERIKYFGPMDMQRKIDEYKRVYHLSEGDDYEFYYYKIPHHLLPIDESLSLKIYRWELSNGKL